MKNVRIVTVRLMKPEPLSKWLVIAGIVRCVPASSLGVGLNEYAMALLFGLCTMRISGRSRYPVGFITPEPGFGFCPVCGIGFAVRYRRFIQLGSMPRLLNVTPIEISFLISTSFHFTLLPVASIASRYIRVSGLRLGTAKYHPVMLRLMSRSTLRNKATRCRKALDGFGFRTDGLDYLSQRMTNGFIR